MMDDNESLNFLRLFDSTKKKPRLPTILPNGGCRENVFFKFRFPLTENAQHLRLLDHFCLLDHSPLDISKPSPYR